MSITFTYPGVYIQEIPDSEHTIPRVSTSTTAFIGIAKKGPVDEATTIHSFTGYERIFGGIWDKSNLSIAVAQYFLNGGREAVVVRVHDHAKIATFQIDGSDLRLQASSVGIWGTNLDIRISYQLENDIMDKYDNTTAFSLTVKDTETKAWEIFRNLSTGRGDKRYISHLVNKWSNLIRVIEPVSELKKPPEGKFKLVNDSASDGYRYLTDDKIIGNRGLSGTGIYSLDEVESISMLCIPPYSEDNTTSKNVYLKALEYCEARRAILIVDPPEKWTTSKPTIDEIEKEFGNIRRPNAVVFLPRIKASDHIQKNNGDNFRSLVPSGVVAGMISRIDVKGGVWKGPAGIEVTLVGVFDFTLQLTDEDTEMLNSLGINCLRMIPSSGVVVSGYTTMSTTDEWKYLPVRRTALFIEESLYRGTQWAVFEPNNEVLWSQIRHNVGAFMQGLFRKGAFQGATPEEAYLIKCDHETTKQYDINRGVVNIIVGFAPLKSSEFVILRIQQLAGQGA